MAARLRRAGSSPLGWLGVYYIATGIFPFVSRRAFEAITGPKREWWLVETVGGLVTAVGVGMLGGSLREDEPPREILGVAAGCAATLAAIDMVYTARGRLRPVYLVDAAIEMAGLAAVARLARAAPSAGAGASLLRPPPAAAAAGTSPAPRPSSAAR